MMSIRRFVVLVGVVVLLVGDSGCVSTDSEVVREYNRHAENSGSPFRLKYRENFFGGGGTFTTCMIDLPQGSTKADSELKSEITKAIDDYETVMGRSVHPIAGVKMLPDGREVWILDFDIGMPNWFSKTAN